ncbi:MAG: hypothetical protein IJT46_02935 [Bacteroidaceae bacterium]|nr:hypothetical protein [Bacteroidaceae bacterium]
MNVKVLENNGYKLKVRSDSGTQLLVAIRHYTQQGTTMRGRNYYTGMVWNVFEWYNGKRYPISGIKPTMYSKKEVIDAIKAHPSFRIAASELSDN